MRVGDELAAAAIAAVLMGAAAASSRTWDFEADAVGGPAKGFTAEVGRWEVAQDGGNRVLAQRERNANRVYNVAMVEGTSYKDVDVSVRVKPGAGELDQGGGLVWRAKDKDNYYIARFNPLEDNLRLYLVENGRRTQLDHADVKGDREWHTLRITMKDRDITGWLDGEKLLVAEDSAFPDAGRVGVWSKADAQSYFDDLKADEIR
jgi:hypothetical protein